MTVRLGMSFTEVPMEKAPELIEDPNVVFEQKFDGTRVLSIVTPKGVRFLQRGGKELSHAAAKLHLPSLEPVLKSLGDGAGDFEFVLDGELMIRTGQLWLFDVPYLRVGSAEFVTPATRFGERRDAAVVAFNGALEGSNIRFVRQARTPDQKRSLLDAVNAAGAEGIVAKELSGDYVPGKRVRHTSKIKLVKTADVIVTAVDRPDVKHGSFTFGVAMSYGSQPAGSEKLVVLPHLGSAPIRVLGKCSAIGKPNARVGDVIEVAYLYREPESGGLVQPRMMRIRTDKRPADCLIDQFPIYSREPVAFSGF